MSRQYDDGLHMMELQGGSFVKSLVACYYCADSENKRKLKSTFSKYFDAYEQRFEEWRRTQHTKDTP